MDWLLRPDSGLSLPAKERLIIAIVLPTLNWGIKCWSIASDTSLRRVQTCITKDLRRMLGVKWHHYVENSVLFRITRVPTVTEMITHFSNRYRDRLLHSNRLARRLATPLFTYPLMLGFFFVLTTRKQEPFL